MLRDFIDLKTNELKDTAFSKIISLTNKGKEQILERVEKQIPGITKQINAIKALEIVEYAADNKMGSYFRSGVGAYGLVSFNPLLLATEIITSPKVFAEVLKKYGMTKQGIRKYLQKLKEGTKLNSAEEKETSSIFKKVRKEIEVKEKAGIIKKKPQLVKDLEAMRKGFKEVKFKELSLLELCYIQFKEVDFIKRQELQKVINKN